MMWLSPAWDEVTYWALDLETGGLDARRDAIVAVGMVPIEHGVIRLSETFESLVRPNVSDVIEPDSVAVHALVPAEVRGAPALPEVLAEVDRRVAGQVLLVHNEAIDVAFLRRAYAQSGMKWPRPAVVDTVKLLFKLAKRRRFLEPDAQQREPQINLSLARQELGLPAYGAHNALVDALAAAELFLVLRARLDARTLRDLR